MRKLITICLVVGILAICVPAQANVMTMADLLQGATITSGDKLFYGFSNYDSSASGPMALPVNAADINVSPYQNSLNEEYGLLFQSMKFTINGIPMSQTTSFEYLVTPTLAGYLISDNTLTMTGTVSAGQITISETAYNAADGTRLASKMTTMIIPNDHIDYNPPAQVVHVYTSISLVSYGGLSKLTEFTQTFSQVPEPATICLLGLGALSLIRRKRSV